MNVKQFKSLIRKKRIMIFIAGVILIGAVPLLPFRGIQFGMDFVGGTMLDLELDEEVDPTQMSTLVGVLEERVNLYGLRDVTISPHEGKFVRIEVAETDPAAVDQIRSIIGEQGSFETLYDGEVVLRGESITNVIDDPARGYGASGTEERGYRWTVPFRIDLDAAEKFAEAVEGECTPRFGPDGEEGNCEEVLYMYIDRPTDALVIMDNSMYREERSLPLSLVKEDEADMRGTTVEIEEAVRNSQAELLVKEEITTDILNETGGKNVIVPEGRYSQEELGLIENAQEVREVPKVRDYWITDALNLENIVHLTPSITTGESVETPSITGHATTLEQAQEEINRMQILLRSGRLPVGVQVQSISRVSPLLGQRFLRYSIIAGAAAILAVVIVITLRYRRKAVTVPMLITSLSEVLLTIGAAAWIGWQIDLPAIAAIIAVVGTGVDHQVIMTDEALRKSTERRRSLARRIKKAFSIIIRAATTTIFAMFPLLFMGLAALQGFAIVTIIGTLVGVLISRPAYRVMINEFL